MFDPRQTLTAASTAAGAPVSPAADRVMKISPLDLRQQRFRHAFRGFDRTEVVAFLTEAADDYEHALREIDRLRQDVGKLDALLSEHRDRETNLRNTLLTAQRLADEIRQNAESEAQLVIREAENRADMILQKAQGRLDEIERGITELRLRRGDVEGSLEASIQALYRALEFIREQDRTDEKVLLHRPRQDAPLARAIEAPREERTAGG
jgi:cell division initiation protein